MAKLELGLRIQNLESFEELVAALGGWAEEASEKVLLSEAEQRLLDAAVDLSGNPQS